MPWWSSITSRINAPDVLALYGIGMVIWGTGWVVWSLVETIPPQSWPVTQGEVVRAYYVTEPFSTKFESGYIYVPVIRHRYAIGSQNYRSDTTWTGKRVTYRILAETEAFLARYPAGSKIAVRYDPAAPERSTLFVETDYAMLGTAGMGLFLFLLSCLMRWPGKQEEP